ncbi:hypothetical protein C7441_107207 [Pseudaminobacter salicylatoxidans]|uniref:Uncharacterized protein n=2 Tax=Pseudaminobacter salicylatoxidans TaxID=93369 RepID=A0A316CPC8_PSESE|nr:hypothetical protein C7441_107207 [Pseudaminobacter salicylatoxidans]
MTMARATKPGSFMPEAQRQEMMNEPFAMTLPAELAGAVNLMAHPVAGAAAFSALGFGMASQAFGLWMGAMAGAADASRRALEVLAADGVEGVSQPRATADRTKKTKH